MHFSKLLYYEACTKLAFDPKPLKGLEIWAFEDGSPVVRDTMVSPEELEQWLQQEGKFRVPQQVVQRKVVGGARLLVQKWRRPSTGYVSGILTMPFDRLSFAKMIGEFLLPRSVASDFAGETYVPARLELVKGSDGSTRIGIVYQSPALFNIFTSMALSYNPATRMTCGLVRMMSESPSEDEHIATLVPTVKLLAEKAMHPLLLPSLAYGMWHDVLRIQHRTVHDSLTSVQFSTGLMWGYLHHGHDDPTVNTPAQDYGTVHAKIVTQHAFLSTALSDFVAASGSGLETAIYEIQKIDNSTSLPRLGVIREELLAYISYIRSKVTTEMQHREILLGKVQIQLQVVYNLMQQRDTHINQNIAIETRRDSSAMKSLALITMIFLPTTAIATIFSISAFFSSSTEGNDLQMGHDIWIFWAVTIPLTFLVLLFFVLWINREKIYSYMETWSGYQHLKDDEEQAKPSNKNEQSRAPDHTSSKRRTSSSQRVRRLSVAEAEKWNTLQDILRDHPANSIHNYYETPQVQVETQHYRPSKPTGLAAIQEESPGNSSQRDNTATKGPQPTSKTAASSPSETTKITTTPRPPIFGPRGMNSSIGWDAEALQLEYDNLIRYISTHRDRRWSGRVRLDQDDDQRYRSKTVGPFWSRRWHL